MGATVEYHKRGPLSENQKNPLGPVKIKAKKQLLANPRPYPRPPTLCLARGLGRPTESLPRSRPRTKGLGRPTESPPRSKPRRKASDGLPIFRLARGLARKASDGEPILRLARGRLGNNPVASASTNLPNQASHPINATNHSRDVRRTTAQHNRAADETGSRISTIPSKTG